MFNFKKKPIKSKIVNLSKTKSFTFHNGFIIPNGSKSLTRDNVDYYYNTCSPLATAVDWIRDEIKNLPLEIKKGEDFNDNHSLLQFLSNPNSDKTQIDFLENLSTHWLLSNEVYLLGTGQSDNVYEMFVIPAADVSVELGNDNLPTNYTVQKSNGKQVTFYRDNSNFRFYDYTGVHELWQIKGFSANPNNANESVSLLKSIETEISQHIEANRFNLNGLNNGVLPSGTVEVDENFNFTDEKFERLQEQIVNFYAGSENSKKAMILEGAKFIPIDSRRDMDFEKLNDKVTKAIFLRFKIPLELISTERASQATAESATLHLYDNAVIPTANRLLGELTKFLQGRFKLNEDEKITYNPNEITALQSRKNEQIKLEAEIGVATTNELRTKLGYSELSDESVDTPLVLLRTPTQVNSVKMTSKNDFVRVMKGQKDNKGNIYTEKQLVLIADKAGLR